MFSIEVFWNSGILINPKVCFGSEKTPESNWLPLHLLKYKHQFLVLSAHNITFHLLYWCWPVLPHGWILCRAGGRRRMNQRFSYKKEMENACWAGSSVYLRHHPQPWLSFCEASIEAGRLWAAPCSAWGTSPPDWGQTFFFLQVHNPLIMFCWTWVVAGTRSVFLCWGCDGASCFFSLLIGL